MGSRGLGGNLSPQQASMLSGKHAESDDTTPIFMPQRMFQMEGNAPIDQGNKLRLRDGKRLA